MKITKKLVAVLVAMMLVVGCSIGGTLAWLVTKTNSVVNTFTAGNINIKLAEPNYNPNDNMIFPGCELSKDPTVTVAAGSESCYVRMYMIIRWTDEADGYFAGDEAEGWFNIQSGWTPGESYIDRESDKTLVNIYEFRYSDIVIASLEKDETLTPLFTKISVPNTLTGAKFASLDNSQVEIVAQAVQSEGFSSADEAFVAASRPTYVTQLIEEYYPETP